MRQCSRGGLVVALVVFVLLLLLVWPSMAQSPLAGSQVITMEHGPDGLWLNQAWLVEWQAMPSMRAALVYDLEKRSSDMSDWVLAYRQWDASLTWQPVGTSWLPWSVTAGRRWRTGVSGNSLGGAGPWEYVMLSAGW